MKPTKDHDEEMTPETMKQRKIAVKMARKAAAQGDPLAGALSELERLAGPYFLGVDEDENSEDLDVFP